MIDKVMDGFNPSNDIIDRRLYYEVTGSNLYPGEFFDDEGSDEEWERAPDPLHHAFSFNERRDTRRDTSAKKYQ